MMKRRDFVLLVAGAITAPRALRAQQKAMSVVGSLSPSSPPATLADMLRSPFSQGISEMGFIYGQNSICECRWADFHYDRLPALAADLVSRKVDVILAGGNAPAVAAKNATSTIPIVFISGDPIGQGLIAGLARPGGNLTGVSILTFELIADSDDAGRAFRLMSATCSD